MKYRQKNIPIQRGFTLIEMMVAVAVFGIILAIAMPSFQAMIKNSQVRNAAESVSNGLSKARAEAVNRNLDVAFVLNPGTSSGTSWSVVQVSGSVAIESRASNEGSADVTLTAVDGASATATAVTFSSLGGIKSNIAAVATNPNAIDTVDFTATGADRDLRVTINAGGKTKMCDPSLTAGSSPRAC